MSSTKITEEIKKLQKKWAQNIKKLAKNGIFDAFWPERESKRRLNIFFMVFYAIHDKKIIFMHRFYKISILLIQVYPPF